MKIDQVELPASARNQWDRLLQAGMWPVAVVCSCGKAMVQAGNSDSPLLEYWLADHEGQEGHTVQFVESWKEQEEEAAQDGQSAAAMSSVGVTITGPTIKRTVIKPGWFIDGSGEPPVPHLGVVVEDGEIAWIGLANDLRPDIADAEYVEAPGATLLPGLIDSHVHLMCPAANERVDAEYYTSATAEQLLLRATGTAQAALWAGVTTLRDLGSRGLLLTSLRDEIAAGHVAGPRLQVAGPAITTTGGHFWYMGYEADTLEDLLRAVRTLHKGKVDVIKVMASGGHTTPGSSPQHAQYTTEQLRALVQDVHRLGHPVTAHVHAVGAIRSAVEAGVDCLEHCTWLGPDGRPAYDVELAKQIADKGIFVSLAQGARSRLPIEQAVEGMGEAEAENFKLRRAGRQESLRSMLDLGCRIVDSTDAGMALTHTQDFALSLEPLVKTYGMSEVEAICSATGLAAECLGLAGQVGTLAPGKRADLLLVDGDASKDIRALTRVIRVFKDGKTVFQRANASKAEAAAPVQ